MKACYFDKFRQFVRLSIPMAALIMSTAFYTSCGPDEDPYKEPVPETPVEPNHPSGKTVYHFPINSISELAVKASEIEKISKNKSDSANIVINANLGITLQDLTSTLETLTTAAAEPNVSLNWQGHHVYSSDPNGVTLDKPSAIVLAKIPFDNSFYVENTNLLSLFTQEQRKLLNKRTTETEVFIVFDGADTFYSRMRDVINAAQDPAVKKATLSFQKNIEDYIEHWTASYIFLRDVKYTHVEKQPGKQVAYSNSKFILEKYDGVDINLKFKTSNQVTPEKTLTKLWGWPFEPINLNIYIGGHNVVTLAKSDSLPRMFRTYATARKTKETHPEIVFNIISSVKQNGLDDPWLAQYTHGEGPQKKDIFQNDVEDMVNLNGRIMDYDISNGRSGEFLMWSAVKATVGSKLVNKFAPIIKNPENTTIYLQLPEDDCFTYYQPRYDITYTAIEDVHDGQLQRTLGIKHKSNSRIEIRSKNNNHLVFIQVTDLHPYLDRGLTMPLKYFTATLEYLNENNVYPRNQTNSVCYPYGSPIDGEYTTGSKPIPFDPVRVRKSNIGR